MVVAKRAGISRQFRERPAGYSLRAPHNATSVIGDPAEFRGEGTRIVFGITNKEKRTSAACGLRLWKIIDSY